MIPKKLNEKQIFTLKYIGDGGELRRVLDHAASKYTRFAVHRWFAGEVDITAQTKSLRKRGLLKTSPKVGFKLSKAGEEELTKHVVPVSRS